MNPQGVLFIPEAGFLVLIAASIAVSMVAIVVLAALLVRDWRNGRLW